MIESVDLLYLLNIRIYIILLFLVLTLSSNFANALCVKTEKSNLRTGPGKNYKITWKIIRNMPLKYIMKKGKWYKVRDFEGDTHWIYSKHVTSRKKCVVIRAKKANLRTGPGTKFSKSKVIPLAEKYNTFEFVKRKGNWVNIRDEYSESYWVHFKLIWMQ